MSAKKERSSGGRLFRFILLCLAALVFAMAVRADLIQVLCVELPLPDLPAAFEGTRIVYVSDIHLTTLNSQRKVNALFEQLAQIRPDILLLGGDYTGDDLIGRLMAGSNGEYIAKVTEARDLFFLSLANFDAPLGKYAVPGDMDNLLERNASTPLKEAASLGGVRLLRDEAVRITKNGQALTIVGVDDWRTGMQDIWSPLNGVRTGDCVIVLSHNPEALPQLNTRPAEDSGLWADAALCGHTLGGLVRLVGYELFSPLAGNPRFTAGWHMENGTKLLISEGLNGFFLPLRFGTSPQVHVITLVRKAAE